MTEEKYTVTMGYVEPVTYRVFEDGCMTTYCYSINRDEQGRETGRAAPIMLGTLGWGDGNAFTEDDYNNIVSGTLPKRRGWLARLITRIGK